MPRGIFAGLLSFLHILCYNKKPNCFPKSSILLCFPRESPAPQPGRKENEMDDLGVKPLPQNRFLRGAYLMLQRYLRHNVGIQSAALAFYLLFTMFPLMIFFNALLGVLHLNITGMFADAAEFLPKVVIDFMNTYLNYVGESPSLRLVWFGLFFSIYFPMRATNSLMRAVRTAYHLGPPQGAVRHLLKSLLYTVCLILTIMLTLILLTVGNLILTYATENFGLPQLAADLWKWLRFPVMALLMFFALALLYALTQDRRQPRKNIYPGVLGSLIAWMVLSLVFSFYVENIAGYSLIYGSIGTLIALLVWLYMSSASLIMGAELNGTLMSMRKESIPGSYSAEQRAAL